MIPSDTIEKLAQSLFQALPAQFQSFEQSCKQQFHDVLSRTFQSLHLVTREEFDVQVKVLARTREKVEQLEALLATLQHPES